MNTLKILGDAEVESLHQATLRILAEVGVSLDHTAARGMLADAGATFQNECVLLPPELVEDCLAKCPKSHVRIEAGRKCQQATYGGTHGRVS